MHKNTKVLCRPGAKINDITRQVKNLRCQKKDLIITHVGTNNQQKMGSEKLIDGMEQLCETARAKTDSHIVIGLLPRYKDGRQLYDDKILYINRRLKATSHDKDFISLMFTGHSMKNPTCLKMVCISMVRVLGYLVPVLV